MQHARIAQGEQKLGLATNRGKAPVPVPEMEVDMVLLVDDVRAPLPLLATRPGLCRRSSHTRIDTLPVFFPFPSPSHL